MAFDLAAVEAATPLCIAQGIRLFQSHMFAADDRGQVANILEWLAPTMYSTVADFGCGIGETCRLMSEMREDLRFWLVNISRVQLRYCPRDGARFTNVVADMNRCAPVFAHYGLLNTALANMDPARAFANIALCVGEALLVTDFVRLSGDNEDFEKHLGGHALYSDEMLEFAEDAGFRLDWFRQMPGDDSHLRRLLGDEKLAAHLLDPVRAGVWRFVKA